MPKSNEIKPDKPILILGGTKEAAELAEHLSERGFTVTTSLAGRTREPASLKGKTRTGGFGGAEGLADYLTASRIALLVDMTHPFATNISRNAMEAATLSGVKLIAWQRPAWEQMEGDQWQLVASITDAVTAIPPSARVLLALGSQHIAPFATRSDVHFLVRMVDTPTTPLDLPDHELLAAKPGSVEQEFALLKDHDITHIICRNSGGKASYTKIAAARLLGLPVIMITQQTEKPATASFDSLVEEIFLNLR
ncbi:MAG: cobalt-precorrin-6A reductase [Rhizobiaceae bacterium]